MRTNPAAFRNPHSRRNQLARAAWGVAYVLLFRPSPWFMGAWRTWLLRRFGARIGDARFHGSVRVWAPWLLDVGRDVWVDRGVNLYNAFGVSIGDRVVISQGSFLCSASHDHRDPQYELIGGRVTIADDCWVAAEAFVGPGVTVGVGTVVAARAVVVKDTAPWTVVGGNPARAIRSRQLRSPAAPAGPPTAEEPA